jgi:hypothetical protein
MAIVPTFEAEEGDTIEVRQGVLFNARTGRSFPVTPMPAARQAILDAGGLIPYTRRLLVERESAHTT